MIEQNIMVIENSTIPGIYLYRDTMDNVYLSSPNATYDLPFEQTRESLLDVEHYKSFIKKSISSFRSSKAYKAYKSYLIGLGLDHCQIYGYLGEEELGNNGLQMHHNFLTIFDIAILITEHVVNTTGKITSFDLVYLLIQEHSDNNIPIVMLSETPHELYHSDSTNYLPPNMTFGRWWRLLYKYSYGITIDIAKKVIEFTQRYLDNEDHMVIKLRDDIINFSNYNTYGNRTYCNTSNIIVDQNQDFTYNFDPNECQY